MVLICVTLNTLHHLYESTQRQEARLVKCWPALARIVRECQILRIPASPNVNHNVSWKAGAQKEKPRWKLRLTSVWETTLSMPNSMSFERT